MTLLELHILAVPTLLKAMGVPDDEMLEKDHSKVFILTA